ncbi:MAG: flavodoxin domain-containing protein [Burkholderiaceae bacterium]
MDEAATPLAGLRYSVFGCGNSDWASTFQAIPQRIDAGLERLGARRVHARGEGDAKDDFDGALEAWVRPMWARIGSDLGIELGKPVAGALYAVEVLDAERARPFADTFGARPMRVAVNRELRTGPVQQVGSTRHIEIELPADVRYRAGDPLGVLPRNDDALVRRAAARFGLAPDTTIRITARTHRETFLPVGERITMGELLADYVELQQVATRAQIRTLAAYCECPFTKPRLEALAADGQAGEGSPYRVEVLSRRRSVLDLLDAFEAIRLPLDVYLEMLPPLSPRFYSIASSPLHDPARCSLTVAVVARPARSGQGSFAGVCSSYLARQLDDGCRVHAFVRDPQTAFRLPADPRTPIVMIGPGTGLAPFRGFLQERAAQRAAGQAIGDAMLFFGCRHPDQDYLYRDELEAFARDGVTELHVAFSRQSDRKVYVQDLLREQRERVWSLLARGGVVYVCGDASRMEPDVRTALTGIAGSCGGMSDEDARAHVDALVSGGRYLVDVWAAG